MFCPAALQTLCSRPPPQIMVTMTGLSLAAGRFGLAPTVKKGTTAGLKMVDRSNSSGVMSNDPSGEHAQAPHPHAEACARMQLQAPACRCMRPHAPARTPARPHAAAKPACARAPARAACHVRARMGPSRAPQGANKLRPRSHPQASPSWTPWRWARSATCWAWASCWACARPAACEVCASLPLLSLQPLCVVSQTPRSVLYL